MERHRKYKEVKLCKYMTYNYRLHIEATRSWYGTRRTHNVGVLGALCLCRYKHIRNNVLLFAHTHTHTTHVLRFRVI